MKVYLSGGSGLGKTTLAKNICKKYGVTYKGSITRNAAKNDPNFMDKPFEYRQAMLLNKMLEFHYSDEDRILNDRSYLDYYVWSAKVLHKKISKKGLPETLFNPDDILIIVPTPINVNWYLDNISIFWDDKLRREAYIQVSNYKAKTKTDLAKVLYNVTSELENKITELALYSHPNPKNIIHPKATVNYFDWSIQTLDELKNFL